jgi:hypothetical protein
MYSDNSHKFIAVLNRKIELPKTHERSRSLQRWTRFDSQGR